MQPERRIVLDPFTGRGYMADQRTGMFDGPSDNAGSGESG